MSRLSAGKMTSGASTSASPNVARKKKRQRYRMLNDVLKDPAAALPGASSPPEMSITENTHPDDDIHWGVMLLVGLASGNYEAGESLGIVLEDRALVETVGRSSDTFVTNNVANGSGDYRQEQGGPSSRPKRNGKEPIWMKDYMRDTE